VEDGVVQVPAGRKQEKKGGQVISSVDVVDIPQVIEEEEV
jgi:hypothetical protein